MVSEYVPTFNRLFREATALRQFLENDDVHLLHPSDLSSQRLLRVSPETIGRLESLEQVSIDLAKVQDLLRVSQSCIRLRIAQVKSSLTPVNLIPVEIMRQIFSNCITAVDDSKAVRSTVMALSQVSTRWREIAIGHSSLWSLLDLSWSDSLISLWRSRAGSQRRLDVVMHSLDDQKSITPANTTSKWRSLHYEFLAMGHDTPKLFHSPLFDDRLHGLEMLNLAPNGGDWGIGSTCFGHKLPHLHTLRLMGQFHIEFNYASLGKQLVNLTVSRLDYQQLKAVCWSCTRLERLCISVWRYSPSSKDKTVVMPKTLRNLIIMNTEAYILDRLFEDISAPDLTKLSVYLPKVEHFSRRYDISIQLMESFFTQAPKIEQLSVLSDFQFTHDVLTSLARAISPFGSVEGISQAPFLLPNLNSLEIGLDMHISTLSRPRRLGASSYEMIGRELTALLRARSGEDQWLNGTRRRYRLSCSPLGNSSGHLEAAGWLGDRVVSTQSRNALDSLCIEGPIDEREKAWLMGKVRTLLVRPQGNEGWMPF